MGRALPTANDAEPGIIAVFSMQNIVRQLELLIFGYIARSLTNRAHFLFGALAVLPLLTFLGAPPFHVADTGPGNFFFAVAFRTYLFFCSSHSIPP